MRIYISAPYTRGDVAINVKRVIAVADELLDRNYIPYVPHLTHLWHIISPHPWSVWMKIDLAFIECCDALLRLDGESIGADAEVERAKELGIPVYYSIEELDAGMVSAK